MRLDKLTLKAQEVIQTSQQTAERLGHQQIEPEHLLAAAFELTDGAIPPILGKIGANQGQLRKEIGAALERLPRISGTGYGQAYISPRTKAVLDQAFKEAEQMRDEFISLEHILIAVTEEKEGEAARILASSGITRDSVLGGNESLIRTRKINTRLWNVSVGTLPRTHQRAIWIR